MLIHRTTPLRARLKPHTLFHHPRTKQPIFHYTTTPPRSLPRRILRSTILYSSLATFSFLTGCYIGFSYLPNQPALLALFTARPISDRDSLTYTPEDAATNEINTAILSSSLAQQLRADSRFTESRPHVKIPKDLRPASMTAGVLSGPGRIAVPPLAFNEEGGKSMTAIFYLGSQLCGHPGIVHGGLLATMLDEGLARCCFPALPNKMGVTASLKVDYRKPARADRYYVLKAETTKVEGRKAWVRGWIEECEVGEGGVVTNGNKVTEGEALFVEPKNANVLRRIYPVAAES